MTITCTACAQEKEAKPTASGEARLPRGWKKMTDGSTLCGDCKSSQYVVRVISIPVHSPIDATWKQFGESLRKVSRVTCQVANLIVREFAKSDPQTPPGQKVAKWMPPASVYHAARAFAPEYDTNSLASLMQTVQGKYRSDRWEIHHGRKSLTSFRDDMPVPIKGSAVKYGFDAEGRPMVSIRLGSKAAEGRDAERYTLSLKNGKEFRPHRAIFEQVVSGTVPSGETKLVALRQGGCLVRIVVTVPRKPVRDRAGILKIKTAADCLLTCQVDGDDRVWRLNADEVRRVIAGHNRHKNVIQRMADDLKFERRIREPDDISQAREKCVAKNHARMHTSVHHFSRMVVEYAKRTRVAGIMLDFTDTTYADFPYSMLKTQIEQKSRAEGLEIVVSASATPEGGEGSPAVAG